jgi:hypothetical protein
MTVASLTCRARTFRLMAGVTTTTLAEAQSAHRDVVGLGPIVIPLAGIVLGVVLLVGTRERRGY